MKRAIRLWGPSFVLLIASVANGQGITRFGFDLDQGTEISGAAGSTIQITGHATISASEAGVNGWTCGFETRTPDGLEFCINPFTEQTLPVPTPGSLDAVDK